MGGIIAESIIIKVGHGVIAVPRKSEKEKKEGQKFNKTLDIQSETLPGVRLSRFEEGIGDEGTHFRTPEPSI